MQLLYRLTSPSGAVYIGQTRNFKARMANYRSMTNPSQPLLYRSLQKYGFDNHQLDILHRFPDEVSQTIIDNYEMYAIQMHKNMRGVRLLNCNRGGSGTPRHSAVRALSRPDVQGANHPLAKLSSDDICAIRTAYRWGSSEFGTRALAEQFGVSPRLIHNIVTDKAWTHIDGPRIERRTVSKLTLLQAEEIRAKYATGNYTHRSLAKEYGATHNTVGKIIKRPNWGRLHAAKSPIFEESQRRLL